MFRFIVATLVLSGVAITSAASAQTAMIGVLEERPPATTAEKLLPVVRAVFYRQGAAWKAFDSTSLKPAGFPAETRWTIGYDGKALGEVVGQTPKAWAFYSDIGQQSITAAKAPFVGKRSMAFAGDAGVAVYRPLVATSTASVADPEGWKRGQLAEDVAARLRKSFHAKNGKALHCASLEAKAAPLNYADGDLVIDRVYVSKLKWSVASIALPADRYGCDGPLDDGAGSPYIARTYAISPEGVASEIGTGLQLVDAGDYDGEGHSELVFQLSGANRGGYLLASDGFKASATFAFSYH